MDGFNNGLNAAEERVRSKENIQNALQRDNKDGEGRRGYETERAEKRLIGVPREREMGRDNVQGMEAGSFPELIEGNQAIADSRHQKSPQGDKYKEPPPQSITVKLPKTKGVESKEPDALPKEPW